MTYETHNKNKNKGYRGPRRNWRISRHTPYNALAAKNFRTVEKMFYYYRKIKLAVEEIRGEQGFYKGGAPTGGAPTNHAFVSDPTASMALKRYAPIKRIVLNAETLHEDVVENPESWLQVVEQTLMAFDGDSELVGKLIRRRYIKNEPMPTTCIDLEINKNKYYALRDIGISYARECAIQLGLIKAF